MAVEKINIGNLVNDGLGDDLRTAFQKVNLNFANLENRLTITAENVGIGAPIFKRKDGENLEFKTLLSERNIEITEFDDAIRIRNKNEAFLQINTDNAGVINANDHRLITLQGGADIEVSAIGSVITIDTNNTLNSLSFTEILSTYDFGYITGVFDHVIQFTLSASNIDFGNITIPSGLNLDCGTIVN